MRLLSFCFLIILYEKRFKTGLVIGRFQPFHKGHHYLIKKALLSVNNLIVGIGSSNVRNKENPLGYQKRRKMVEMYLEEEKLKGRVIKVVPLPDYPSDCLWFSETLKRVGGGIDVVIGNNDWVNGIFEKAGYLIMRVPYYKKHILEGEKIRKLIQKGERWKDRVPEYLVPEIILSLSR